MLDERGTGSGWRWFAEKLLRHWEWGRTQGFRRLLDEDALNPLERTSLAVEKWRWRHDQANAGQATAVFLIGVQRSGTNMIVRGLERSPEFEVYNENSRRAFRHFRLRSNSVIRELVERSGHRYVLFKPLCDSHRATELLDELSVRGCAVWAYRGVDGRVRSALAKFGKNNLHVLRQIATGRGGHLWQAQGLSAENREVIRGFDYGQMNPESAAALFWYVRNSLYFELGLDERTDVMPVSYDALVADPEPVMRSLCEFLDFPFHPRLTAHIAARRPPSDVQLRIDPAIRARCDELLERLDAAAERKRAASLLAAEPASESARERSTPTA